MIIKSEQEMLNFGKNFAKSLKNHVIELIGDVGAGKTTFTRGLAEGLGVKEPITSPSFTISKSYPLPNHKGHLIHYDFYRLPDPGLMLDDLRENLENPDNVIVIEWGKSIENTLPKNHTKIEIKYNENNTREISL
ncbi:MAG: tRNA (adenosine(37)-N6)-threonylcarbamoyltransferase complex ATPase subunit type 1 TsaE [Candidatus Saccharibacteria bacterium]|uniref:tRNA threonylcarbamoyladenosine biosynthesis protein TsaE n=1 Tax=Candidatus Nanosyncoccus alces TaxID=2171997 RepID=A0ABY0FNF8_9BACT|nr:tRNA (adenosine(37)-N6)-threonylcarbamoyltransferase complex ATPase subunit type 1 TsaE [Candidatus Nanosyncoccus alces]MDO4399137.1 tRNA (adenosine(37)-N6)-threonylcarbamoyltransferase complex ATPase subunit type 1 TsaE [Candidatus Saccharibacteria bacterium]RYC74859.1 tRNA threonylcarbamoyladenosine biosynthesis protein TsaE [Candidatus Nanosyncoccus alces]